MIDTAILIGFLVVLLAGFVSGLTGFGFALVSAPLLIFFFEPKLVVPLVVIHSALVTIPIVVKYREHIELKKIVPLLVAGLIGIPLGTQILLFVDANLLKAIMGGVILLFSVAMLAGFRKKFEKEKLISLPVGFTSGILAGSTSMSGPPVILFFANQSTKKAVFRATLLTYFLVLNTLTVGSFALSGLLTKQILTYAAVLLPAMLFGLWIGDKAHHKTNERLFKKIVLIIVAISGLVSVVNGLGLV